jgi:hypothetical protein
MVALKSEDAEVDAARFERAGIGGGPSFRFARMMRLPDGTETEIGFALAHSEHAAAPDATFFASQHLAPGALFQPAYLEHPNGAEGVLAVTAVAERPAAFRDFLSAATGQPYLRVDAGEIEAAVDGQRILVVTPDGFRARYGLAAPDPRRGLLFAAFELAVEDVERTLGFSGPTAKRHEGAIVVPPSPGLGTTLVFRKSAHG